MNMKQSFILCVLAAGALCHPGNHTAHNEGNEVSRIVGGQKAYEGQFPFAVAIYRNGDFICTGQLIAKKCVLTACHCVRSDDGTIGSASEFYVTLGFNRDAPIVKTNVTAIKVHENCNLDNLTNDIAILHLEISGIVSNNTKTILLCNSDYGHEGEKATVAGWGYTTIGQIILIPPKILHYVEVDIINQQKCEDSYNTPSLEPIFADLQITNEHICAGNTLKGACNGDSGGPLFSKNAYGEFCTMGVVSFGFIGPCEALQPTVYTRVSSFVSWIKEACKPDMPKVVGE